MNEKIKYGEKLSNRYGSKSIINEISKCTPYTRNKFEKLMDDGCLLIDRRKVDGSIIVFHPDDSTETFENVSMDITINPDLSKPEYVKYLSNKKEGNVYARYKLRYNDHR